jgi:cytochrome c oxidase subunit IV
MTSHGEPHDHIVPVSTYITVFLILMVMTFATVWAAGQDFGAFNTVVAMAIAIFKATLVILFFMHVKYSPRLTQLVVAGAFLWLGIMLAITLNDYYSPRLSGQREPGAHFKNRE